MVRAVGVWVAIAACLGSVGIGSSFGEVTMVRAVGVWVAIAMSWENRVSARCCQRDR
jgi:hypothetical protein